MNPTVLIATHNRYEITSYNIQSLLNQSVQPKIILVVSNLEEKFYYQRKFQECILLISPNHPLGKKWAFGAQHAYNIKANPLIVLGSDDILGPKAIETYVKLMAEHHFIGLKHWYIHHKGKAYYCEYLAKMPLGGGRSYSFWLLDQMNGQIFDDRINRHLDDLAMKKAKNLGIECYSETTIELHAIKGDWPVMNEINLSHPNLKVISHHESINLLPDLY